MSRMLSNGQDPYLSSHQAKATSYDGQYSSSDHWRLGEDVITGVMPSALVRLRSQKNLSLSVLK